MCTLLEGPEFICEESQDRDSGQVDNRQLIERWKQKQIEISRWKGRSSPTDYEPGHKVFIQDHLLKRWSIHGVISKKCVAEDGTSENLLVEKDVGKVVIRNARFLKHEWKNSRKHENWKMRVSANNE